MSVRQRSLCLEILEARRVLAHSSGLVLSNIGTTGDDGALVELPAQAHGVLTAQDTGHVPFEVRELPLNETETNLNPATVDAILAGDGMVNRRQHDITLIVRPRPDMDAKEVPLPGQAEKGVARAAENDRTRLEVLETNGMEPGGDAAMATTALEEETTVILQPAPNVTAKELHLPVKAGKGIQRAAENKRVPFDIETPPPIETTPPEESLSAASLRPEDEIAVILRPAPDVEAKELQLPGKAEKGINRAVENEHVPLEIQDSNGD